MNEMKQPDVRCESDWVQREGLTQESGGKRGARVHRPLRLACLPCSAGSAALVRHSHVLCSKGPARSSTARLGVHTGVRALVPPTLMVKKHEQRWHPHGP